MKQNWEEDVWYFSFIGLLINVKLSTTKYFTTTEEFASTNY